MRIIRSTVAFVVATSIACSRQSAPKGADDAQNCPPCPDGMYCATDVIIKDAETGETVCHPTDCLCGPSPCLRDRSGSLRRTVTSKRAGLGQAHWITTRRPRCCTVMRT